MTDTKDICEAIKGLPDGDTIRWQSRTTIESGEIATNDLYTLLRHYPNALAEVRQISDVIEWWLDKAYGVTPCVMVRYDRDDPKTERIRVGDQSDLKALVAENARLKTEVVAANKGAQVNALVNESLAKKLKLAVEALSDARSHLFAIYNGDWPSDISPTPAGFAQFAVNDIDATLAKIKEPLKGGEQR